jgi:hypothetical protein
METFLQVTLWILVGVPFVVLALVLTGAAIGWRGHQRSIAIASTSPCPNCGKAVGRPAVLAAKDRFSKIIQERMKAHPGVKYRIVAEWEIECPHCGCKFYFYPEGNRIETVSTSTRT